MPLKSGAPRECTSDAPCGVAIGPFRICVELIRPLPRVLRTFGGAMPLKSGAPRECTSKAPCGVVIGPFRNANNGQTCGPPSALYT